MALVNPPTRDGWSYSGDLYVEASGNNRHRRATIPEIKAVFDGSDGSKDRPAHWYEAQLIHYGLPASKTKGTAKMRLFDALNKGALAVPPHISKVESELKKEWTKREREAKQALKKPSAPAASTPAKGAAKRKADAAQLGIGSGTSVNINLTVSLGPHGAIQATPAEPAPKKVKTAKPTQPAKATKPAPSAPSAPAAPTPTPASSRTKQTARRGGSSARAAASVSSRTTPAAPSNKPNTTRPKQTARRSRPFNRAGLGRPAAASSSPARQLDATPAHWDSPDNDPPPPYPGSPVYGGGGYGGDNSDHEAGDCQSATPLPPLGLLNGRYRLRCTGPPEHEDPGEDSGIIFTLDGDALWGSFEIGPLSGILRLDARPRRSSLQPLYFQWRGMDLQGMQHAETDDGSYLKFLGGGAIAGKVGFYGTMLEFSGRRISGQETRSEISAAAMRNEWEERGF